MTRLETWERISERKGLNLDDLTGKPPLHDFLKYLWEIYLDILKGSDRVGYNEINNYREAVGVELTPWETSLIIDIDTERRSNG